MIKNLKIKIKTFILIQKSIVFRKNLIVKFEFKGGLPVGIYYKDDQFDYLKKKTDHLNMIQE